MGFTEDLLIKIGKLILALQQPVTMRKFYHYCYGDLLNEYKDKKVRKKVSSTFYRFKKNKYIIEKRKEGKTYFALTQKGWQKVLKARIKAKKGRQKWDGKYRIVIFDVPEKMKKQRDFFRYCLKQIGFEELQKSVWLVKEDVFKEIEILANSLGMKPFIKFITANKIE